MSRTRRWLLMILLLGIAGNMGGTGTFASFSASTTNDASTFATGTLVLSNTKDSGTACLSTGLNDVIDSGDGVTEDADNSFECGASITVATQQPGDVATVDITLENAGSIDATNLRAFRSAACVNAVDPSATYNGTTNICTNLLLAIQEYDDAERTDVGFCHYGAVVADETACTTTASVNAFAVSYTGATTAAMLDMGPMTNGQQRWFRIFVELPSTAGNGLMGRIATFGFTWRLFQ